MKRKLVMKLCALALTTAMTGSMAGCGNTGSNTESGSNQSSASSDAVSDAGNESEEEISDETTHPEGDETADEESYDCGGATIRVSGITWETLKEDNAGNASYIKAHDTQPAGKKVQCQYRICCLGR